MSQLGITDPPYSEVAECQTTVEGERLEQQVGEETKKVGAEEDGEEGSGPSWVPWVTINGVR